MPGENNRQGGTCEVDLRITQNIWPDHAELILFKVSQKGKKILQAFDILWIVVHLQSMIDSGKSNMAPHQPI